MYTKDNIICKGFWFYEDTRTGVMIEKSNIMYGTGDYEDDDEIYKDKVVSCFYAWSSRAGEIDSYNVGLGCFYNLNGAKKSVEIKLGKVMWE